MSLIWEYIVDVFKIYDLNIHKFSIGIKKKITTCFKNNGTYLYEYTNNDKDNLKLGINVENKEIYIHLPVSFKKNIYSKWCWYMIKNDNLYESENNVHNKQKWKPFGIMINQ